MNTRKINGLHMEKMLRNGLANLCLYEKELNSLNVFPVADGDTGTNMRITLESSLRAAKSTASMGAYLRSLTDAMLYGARGNSGVILSQIFRGIFAALSRCGGVNVIEMRNALISGYKTAYSAVVRPVEGTILTVSREGIEYIKSQIDRNTTFEELLNLYIVEMRRSLARTPEILPQLKEADVVDSGAMGYIVIVEGMLRYLNGDVLTDSVPEEAHRTNTQFTADVSLFNENTVFASGYCVEFILQLMCGKQYSRNFNINRFINDLQDYGGSIVAVQNGKRVKVHIHTFKPARVLSLAQEFGEFVTCKVENMQLQHNSLIKEKPAPARKRTEFAVISVADSERMRIVLHDLGSAYVIMGGAKMSVSVQDFVEAIKTVNADNVVILPNNGNLVGAARQAKELYKDSSVTVLDTHTIPQGYSALAMDIVDEKDCNVRIRQMKMGMNGVETLSVTTAGKDYHSEDVSCSAGMQIAVSDGKLLCAGDEAETVFCDGLKLIPDVDEMETCIVFRGEGKGEELEEKLEKRIAGLFPMLEVSFVDGGSTLYKWTAAIS
ncbi:MAG: DAK2 domain-containing protein [Bacillota bacterium]|nr:DAK2 domain-containing protein [Bacillota bacterium]